MVKWKCFAFLPACSEGGCRCVWLFVPSQETLQGWRACSACSRTLAHWTSITCFPLFLSQLFIPSIDFPAWRFFIYRFPFVFVILHLYDFHFPCFSQAGTSTHTQHTQTHFFQRLISGVTTVWFGKNPNAPLFICVFFPPNTPTGCCIVDVKWF